MGRERSPKWYDGAWLKKRRRHDTIIGSFQDILWSTAVRWIKEVKLPVIDLGCGDGRLAQRLAWDPGFVSTYRGVDFSPAAIQAAKSRPWKDGRFTFAVADITQVSTWCSPKQARCYVLCEVLEHIEDDLKVLEAIPSGQPLWLSVPSFDDESHVRYFKDQHEAIDRYARFFGRAFTHGISALGANAPKPELQGAPHWSLIYGWRA